VETTYPQIWGKFSHLNPLDLKNKKIKKADALEIRDFHNIAPMSSPYIVRRRRNGFVLFLKNKSEHALYVLLELTSLN